MGRILAKFDSLGFLPRVFHYVYYHVGKEIIIKVKKRT